MKTLSLAMLNIFILSLALLSCNKPPEMACSPNYTQGKFGALITYVSNNDFLFEVCYNEEFIGSQVTVYGVSNPADISAINPTTDFRLPHLTDGLYPGDVFPVTFGNDDAWFVIYEDDSFGNYATTTQILKGQFR
jgi:hypothetical protein